jgi:hypothetical protein
LYGERERERDFENIFDIYTIFHCHIQSVRLGERERERERKREIRKVMGSNGVIQQQVKSSKVKSFL